MKADVAKCGADSCINRMSCDRYTRKIAPFQTWAQFTPIVTIGGECDGYERNELARAMDAWHGQELGV